MAGNVYNPSAPQTSGEEWLADSWGAWDLASGPWAQAIRSRTAETINQIKAMIDPADDAVNGLLLAEVFPKGSEIPTGTVSTVSYQPNADVAVGTWKNQAGSGVNIWQSIDEGTDTYSAADYAIGPAPYLSSDYIIRFATNGFSATARALRLQIVIVILSAAPGGSSVDCFLRDTVGTVDYPLPSGVVYDTPKTYTMDLGEINPKTLLPWTPTDVKGFDTVAPLWAMRFSSHVSNANAIKVLACELRVTTQTVENRVAAATYKKPASAVAAGVQTLNNFVALPGAAASWAKPNVGDFTVMFRKPSYAFASWTSHISMLWQSSVVAGSELANIVPGVVSAFPTLDSYGQVTACDFTSLTRGRTLAFLLMTTAPAVSQDSLPYYLTGDSVHLVDISASSTIKQQFTPGASANFVTAKLLISPGDTPSTQNVVVKIKRNSDNVQFGSSENITPAAVAALPADANGFRVVTVTFAVVAALVSGTQYYVELTSTSAVAAGHGWRTIILGDAGMAGGLATFDGTTDVASVAGVAKNDFDMPVLVSQIVNPPAALAAAVQAKTNHVSAPVQECVPASIDAIHLTWTATALGAQWSRYEIRRSEDNGVTWSTIAYVTSAESTAAFDDYESLRGVAAIYQIRVLRTDGTFSVWSASTVARTANARGAEIIFVTNESQTLGCAFTQETDREFEFLAAANDEFIEIYGGDYAVAFMESEDPGLRFARTVTVNFGKQPVTDDVSIFLPIRVIARASVSYVCVLDYAGNRFFAHVQVGKGTWAEPGFRYHADVLISQLSGTPSIAIG